MRSYASRLSREEVELENLRDTHSRLVCTSGLLVHNSGTLLTVNARRLVLDLGKQQDTDVQMARDDGIVAGS